MKIVLELTKDEALTLAAELHRVAVHRGNEAAYRRVQGTVGPRLPKEAKLFHRLSSEIFEKAL